MSTSTKLSIIIVNYNVCDLLRTCLAQIVREADQKYTTEVWVVDNNSSDNSTNMIRSEFPSVKLIANKKNVGYAKANNIAIKKAKGEYVLLLNPDTIIEKNGLTKCLTFMDNHLNAGAMGVKMIDENGNYLPESKRGLPTPFTALYKLLGLYKLFPKSNRFGRYYMSHLDKNSTGPVEVIAGAYMLIRKEVFTSIGYLDENFFMYGEDVDLSYRISNAGFQLYYYPEVTITHLKGKSSKMYDLKKVFNFYNSMIIFSNKHFRKNKYSLPYILVNTSIYSLMGIGYLKSLIGKIKITLQNEI